MAEAMVNTIEPPVKPEAQSQTDTPSVTPDNAPDVQAVIPAEVHTEQASEVPLSPLPERESPVKQAAPKKLLQRFEDFLIPALGLFLLGNVLAYALPDLAFARLDVGLSLIAVFIGIICCGISKPDFRWLVRMDLWMIVLIAGSLYYAHRQFTPAADDVSRLAPLHRAEVMGTVLTHASENRVILTVSQVNGQKASGTVMAYLPTADAQGDGLESGTRILLDGELALPFESKVPGAFNQAEYLKSQHITALLRRPNRIIAFEASKQSYYVLQRTTDQLKHQVSETFAKSLPSPQAEVLGGIVLGDKAIPVDKQTRQAFIQTGLIHVLAASGMNVGIIAGAALWFLSLLKVPYRTRLLVAMVAVGFYSLLTGLPPSIQRAATMLELALFLKLLNRELSPVFLLCVASSLLVLINPENVASIGFQFSVLTTFGLLTMLSPLQEALGYYITRWAAGLILVPLIAQLWIWPLSVAYFNQFPIHTIPLNIVALLMVTPLTVIGFTAGLVSIVLPPLGGLLSWLARPFLDGLLWVVNAGSGMAWAQWSLPSPEPWQLAGLYLGLMGLLAVTYRFKHLSFQRKTLLGLVPFALVLAGLCVENSIAQNYTGMDLVPLSGKREAIIIQPARANQTLLMVPQTLGYYEARALADYFRHRHITRLGAVLLLPETENASKWQSSLKTAFAQTDIDNLFSFTPQAVPQDLKVAHKRQYPLVGAQVEVGDITLAGSAQSLRVLESKQCLVSVSQKLQEASDEASCGLQVLMGTDGTRLFSPQALPMDRYYHVVHQGQELVVY